MLLNLYLDKFIGSKVKWVCTCTNDSDLAKHLEPYQHNLSDYSVNMIKWAGRLKAADPSIKFKTYEFEVRVSTLKGDKLVKVLDIEASSYNLNSIITNNVRNGLRGEQLVINYEESDFIDYMKRWQRELENHNYEVQLMFAVSKDSPRTKVFLVKYDGSNGYIMLNRRILERIRELGEELDLTGSDKFHVELGIVYYGDEQLDSYLSLQRINLAEEDGYKRLCEYIEDYSEIYQVQV